MTRANSGRQDIGVVAIGRNEGERLRACITSLAAQGLTVVYVDSASSDGSPAVAEQFGATVVRLDMSRPFSAARARNEGFERLMQVAPDIQWVQFIDGDCLLVEGWLEHARGYVMQEERVAAVCGRRRERFPAASIYNRLCDMEWNSPIGEAKACGGDALMRKSAFLQVGGFDSGIMAGEEPEMCCRLRRAGWKIMRLDHDMTLHDAAMTHFTQYWRRHIRAGYGLAQLASAPTMRGSNADYPCRRRIASAIFWAILLPLLFTASLVAGAFYWPLLALAALVVVAFIALVGRCFAHRRGKGDGVRAALFYAGLIPPLKLAHCVGVCRFVAAQRGKKTVLIEYKTPVAAAAPVRAE